MIIILSKWKNISLPDAEITITGISLENFCITFLRRKVHKSCKMVQTRSLLNSWGEWGDRGGEILQNEGRLKFSLYINTEVSG